MEIQEGFGEKFIIIITRV